MEIRIGFAKENITPPLGTELGGYAGYRPCTGVHDPLFCKTVVLEQDGERWAVIALDLLCADEAMYRKIAAKTKCLGLTAGRMVVSAIHSHAAPVGIVPGEGPLARIDAGSTPDNAEFEAYMESVVSAAVETCCRAVESLEPFQVRMAQGTVQCIGSERHTGADARALLTAVQCRTPSGKNLILYNYPCHPTVMSAANLEVSADFASGIEAELGADMAVFLNGAAGDISTRFTRREQTFDECARLGRVAAEQIQDLLAEAEYGDPLPVRGLHSTVTLQARPVETEEEALRNLEERTAQWKQAEAAEMDPGTVRILKSYVEGAGVSLHFARTMAGIREFHLPVTVLRMGDLKIATIPGELFSTLLPEEPLAAVCYANGYYRYIADKQAYDDQYYEAMAAILARGAGEILMERIREMLVQLN